MGTLLGDEMPSALTTMLVLAGMDDGPCGSSSTFRHQGFYGSSSGLGPQNAGRGALAGSRQPGRDGAVSGASTTTPVLLLQHQQTNLPWKFGTSSV